MIPGENNVPEFARCSLLHLRRGEKPDHVLAARTWPRFFAGAEIHDEALPDVFGAFRTDQRFPKSDHAPVLARFSLPLKREFPNNLAYFFPSYPAPDPLPFLT
jgi:hypothetical protein